MSGKKRRNSRYPYAITGIIQVPSVDSGLGIVIFGVRMFGLSFRISRVASPFPTLRPIMKAPASAETAHKAITSGQYIRLYPSGCLYAMNVIPVSSARSEEHTSEL